MRQNGSKLKEAIREAHNQDLPDDWIYEECCAVCEAWDNGELSLDDMGEPNYDDAHDFADGRVDIYTHEVYQWVADMCNSRTFAYAEETAKELHNPQADIVYYLKLVQFCAIETIVNIMVAAIKENVSE